ncbi:pyridoxal phosphate-dependent aminotransferase [Peristeroidobacter soli]|jgi:aspartate/methionine/tyrosine aminotransferase|uniref:pyridoxal phosphate-dependent aminotransferase n=1 Tax=Peristeroidobacter soli TaxID=2497877 RepID=UPI001C376766|nr:aminotransferase class I/II-fold pyridoxal phosphate-dependent enzyme [Peristeroidobacter soli]
MSELMVDAGIAPFHAKELSLLARRLAEEGRSVLHMEFGQPSAGAPRGARQAAQAAIDTDPMGYWESPSLRQGLSRHYRDEYGLNISSDRFVVTAGASPALVLALLSHLKPGARVAISRPSYAAYRNTLRALRLTPVEIACGAEVRYQWTAEAIARIDPAPAAIIIASPANPTGTILSPEQLRAIAGVCREREILMISDEIYHGLSYGPRTHSILEFEPDALVINSFSKYFAMPGWRLGWLVAPESRVQRIRDYVSCLFLTPPSVSQHAAIAALNCRAELDANLETYRRNRAMLIEAMPRLGLQTIAPPDGAFYIYADVGHLTADSLSFCRELLEQTGVALGPGIDFDPVEGHRFVRFCFAISAAQTEEAIARLVPWFTQYRRRL